MVAVQLQERRSCPIFADWDTVSSVRARPRTIVESELGKHYFPPALEPCASHPVLTAFGPDAVGDFLVQRLYLYLAFTTVLEQRYINPVLLNVADDDIGVDLPATVRSDAYRIYCDEAYHALMCSDLGEQVRERTGVTSRPGVTPPFTRIVATARRNVPTDLRIAVDLVFAIVSETLISQVLAGVPKDRSVVTAVRRSVADHAADEKRHHAYFADLAHRVWPQFDNTAREYLVPLFADFIEAFLDPGREALTNFLTSVPMPIETATGIVHWAHPPTDRRRHRRAARATIGLLRALGVLDPPDASQLFQSRGLLLR